MIWISQGGNQNISSATCQAQATDPQFARHTGTDSWSSYSHTGMATLCFFLEKVVLLVDKTNLRLTHPFQAMYAGTSISAGMKGASKAMAAMNKV